MRPTHDTYKMQAVVESIIGQVDKVSASNGHQLSVEFGLERSQASLKGSDLRHGSWRQSKRNFDLSRRSSNNSNKQQQRLATIAISNSVASPGRQRSHSPQKERKGLWTFARTSLKCHATEFGCDLLTAFYMQSRIES